MVTIRNGTRIALDNVPVSSGRQGANGQLRLEAAGLSADALGIIAVDGATSAEQGRVAAWLRLRSSNHAFAGAVPVRDLFLRSAGSGLQRNSLRRDCIGAITP